MRDTNKPHNLKLHRFEPNVLRAVGWQNAARHACYKGEDIPWVLDGQPFQHKPALAVSWLSGKRVGTDELDAYIDDVLKESFKPIR